MEDKKVLATVGGREVLKQDLDALLEGMDPQGAAFYSTEEGQEKLLENLIAQELIYLDAVKNELDKNEIFIRESIRMRDSFLKQYAVHQLLKTVTVTEDDLVNFYDENKNIFVESKTVKTSHILVEDEEQAKEIIKEIDDGLSFEEAAKKYSRCPSNAGGGDLGYFARGKMVPEFEEAAFNMEIGEISDPIKTQFGYHIINLTDIKEESEKTFDEVKDQLRQQLLAAKQQKAYADKTNELRGEYDIIINE